MNSCTDNSRLNGLSFKELREQYRSGLFEDFLPFMDKYVIDREYGGFMCHADRDGTRVSTAKRAWFEGRGIWVYSFLHNKFGRDPKHLDVARKSVEFILKNKPEGDNFWPGSFTREGKPLEDPNPPFYGRTSIYGDLFIATGFAEYSKSDGNGHYWDIARGILLKCMNIYDNRPGHCSLPPTDSAPGVDSPRILGHWMVFLRLATEMLESKADPAVEKIAGRCVKAIMDHHFNPEYGLLNEYINHDMSRINSDYGEISTGHGTEVLWMILDEALRIKNRELFDLAAARLKRHIEVFWDDVYGGLMVELVHANRNTWNTQKWLWLQEEALIGVMMVIEHTGVQWAKDWYARISVYMRDKFLLKQYGLLLWIFNAGRKVTFERNSDRIENFHLPRYLMLNLLAIERIINKKEWRN